MAQRNCGQKHATTGDADADCAQSIVGVDCQVMYAFQTLQGVLPMRLRWQFHQLLLSQSMGVYQRRIPLAYFCQSDANRLGGARHHLTLFARKCWCMW